MEALRIAVPPHAYLVPWALRIDVPQVTALGSRSADLCYLPGPKLGSRGVTYRRPPSPESACAQGISIRQFQGIRQYHNIHQFHSIQLRWVFTPIPKNKIHRF